MTAVQALWACCADDLRRYRRSRGLWLILLIAPIGARFLMDGSTIHIALEDHLLVMDWGAVGLTLGVVVSTMLLPVGFLYLRSSVTRRRPWQVEDVAPAPRAAMVLGHFLADSVILLGALAIATFAGGILAWRAGQGAFDLALLTAATWVIAAPSLLCMIALRHLLNAVPITRGALGDVLAFLCWMAMLSLPVAVGHRPSSFVVNLWDPAGYTRPIVGNAPVLDREFAVGGGPVRPGRVAIDTRQGLAADGFLLSRLAWLGIALAVACFAGAIDRPMRVASTKERAWHRWRPHLRFGVHDARDRPAARVRAPWLWQGIDQFLLIGRGGAFLVLAIVAALLGLVGAYRHIGSPAAVLLLVFALSAQAGRNEGRGLAALAATTPTPAFSRRAAFVVAGTIWSLLLAVPAGLQAASIEPLLLASGVGVTAAFLAIAIAAFTGSAFAPRMLLLIGWYAYFAT
jgi:hypothetical protein